MYTVQDEATRRCSDSLAQCCRVVARAASELREWSSLGWAGRGTSCDAADVDVDDV